MLKIKDFYHRIEIMDECFRQKGKKWCMEDLVACVNTKLRDRYNETVSKRTVQYALDYLINKRGAPIEKVREDGMVYYYYSDARSINSTQLKAFPVLIPPLELQQKFASIVADTERLRQRQKQSELELENLFQSLLQKYFG